VGVGGGLLELGPWRIQAGEEGEGLRAFGGCLLARFRGESFAFLAVKSDLLGFCAPLFDSSWLASPAPLFWGFAGLVSSRLLSRAVRRVPQAQLRGFLWVWGNIHSSRL